jgi:hypothetical protein
MMWVAWLFAWLVISNLRSSKTTQLNQRVLLNDLRMPLQNLQAGARKFAGVASEIRVPG